MTNAEQHPVEGIDYTTGRGEIKVPILESIMSVKSPRNFDDYDVLKFFEKLWQFNTAEDFPGIDQGDVRELVLPAKVPGTPRTVVRAGVGYSILEVPRGRRAAPFKKRVEVEYAPPSDRYRTRSANPRAIRMDKAMNDPFKTIYLDGEDLTWWAFIRSNDENQWGVALKRLLDTSVELLSV